jgi:hypothetical protein
MVPTLAPENSPENTTAEVDLATDLDETFSAATFEFSLLDSVSPTLNAWHSLLRANQQGQMERDNAKFRPTDDATVATMHSCRRT